MILFSTGGDAPHPLFPSSLTSRLRWSVDGTRAYLSMQYRSKLRVCRRSNVRFCLSLWARFFRAYRPMVSRRKQKSRQDVAFRFFLTEISLLAHLHPPMRSPGRRRRATSIEFRFSERVERTPLSSRGVSPILT